MSRVFVSHQMSDLDKVAFWGLVGIYPFPDAGYLPFQPTLPPPSPSASPSGSLWQTYKLATEHQSQHLILKLCMK